MEKGLEQQPRRPAGRHAQEAAVQLLGLHRVGDLGGIGLAQVQPDVGVLLGAGAQGARHVGVGGGRAGETQRQPPLLALRHLLQPVAQRIGPRTTNTDFTGRPLASTATLASNQPSARAYVDLIEDWVHTGKVTLAPGLAPVTTFTERDMFRAQDRPPGGSNAAADAACQAAGGGSFCTNTNSRVLGENPNANPNARIYLQETWARPDLINAPGVKLPLDLVTALATYDRNTPAPSDYNSLEAMTAEMAAAMQTIRDHADDDGSAGLAGVVPTGRAFLRAVQDGVATRDMDAANAATDGLIDLWFNDGTHPSAHGSYLSALTLFGSITGLDPQSLGRNEQAAFDLGISQADAAALQRIAALELGFPAAVPEPGQAALLVAGLLGLAGWHRRQGRRPVA